MSLTHQTPSLKERLAFRNESKVRRQLQKHLQSNWKFSEQQSTELNSAAFLALCESVDSPVSLAAWLRFKNDELLQLVTMSINPCDYRSVREFEGDYLCASFFSKYKDFNIDVDRKKLAFTKWLHAEESCASVNAMFRKRWDGDPITWSHSVSAVYHRACQKASSILGHLPSHILTHGKFGPGADLSTKGDKTSKYYKYQSPGTCTPGVLSLIEEFNFDDRRADTIHECEFVRSSRLDFVPKNAKIDRAICIEPRWNVFFQLSVAHVMQERLLRSGFDITDQSRNQRLAAEAYSRGLATIDLSSASDCVSKNLVLDMLPGDWTDILFKLRCPVTSFEGKQYMLEKISSMGNGYTFPLETLIFASIALSVCEHLELPTDDVAVYGDDIIVPQAAAALLVETLREVGFSVNSEKSFVTGAFFESCGSDYFEGKNVRPIFLKEKVTNVERAFRLANQITEFARRRNGYRGACSRILVAWGTVVSRIPESLRLFGSCGTGDSTIHAPFDVGLPTLAGSFWDRRGWEGYVVWGLVRKPLRFPRSGESLLFAKLAGPDMAGNYVSHRGRTGLSVERVYVPRYEDFCII